jgi:hypothetical protein
VAKNAPLQTELLHPVCRTLDVTLRGAMSTPVSRIFRWSNVFMRKPEWKTTSRGNNRSLQPRAATCSAIVSRTRRVDKRRSCRSYNRLFAGLRSQRSKAIVMCLCTSVWLFLRLDGWRSVIHDP